MLYYVRSVMSVFVMAENVLGQVVVWRRRSHTYEVNASSWVRMKSSSSDMIDLLKVENQRVLSLLRSLMKEKA